VRTVLAAIVIPLLLLTIVGLVALWPRGESPVASIPLLADGMSIETARVVNLGDPAAGVEVRAELLTGSRPGQVINVHVPEEVRANGLEEGSRIQLVFAPEAIGSEHSAFVFWDFERSSPMLWLAAIYLLAVLIVARWRGLAAVAGLLASLGIVVVFMLPALMAGHSPPLVALVGASAMMFIAVYLAHGVSVRTTTALLGTFVGLAATTALAAWGTQAAGLNGAYSDTSRMLWGTFPNLNLQQLLLCGILVAGLGALNDVTITQASAVWELHAADPRMPKRKLFSRGMRIGRDHIASTVYTLTFAYVGTALPVLLLTAAMDRSFLSTLGAGEIAEEVVRTLVSSTGLVLAIPVTTFIAVTLVSSTRPETARRVPAPAQR